MTYLETDHLYYNTQVYFCKLVWENIPNDSFMWEVRYSEWLKKQGCVIIHNELPVVRNSLGIAPGYDRFGFENEENATVFLLRWQ